MNRELSLVETRVLGTLYEKQHTVPDSEVQHQLPRKARVPSGTLAQ